MQYHQDWSSQVLSNQTLRQIVPVFVVFIVPTVFVFAFVHLRRLNFDKVSYIFNQILVMVLDSLGFSLPWLLGGPQRVSSSRSKSHRRKPSAGKATKTKPEQITLQKLSNETTQSKGAKHSDSEVDDTHYPGLINISGTYCFMNSTLQAMASLSYLQPHIDSIHSRAEVLDVPTPVIDALKELFRSLNTPRSSYHALRPHNIIHALSSPPPSSGTLRPRTSSTLFNSREHQDAQELFQLVSEYIKSEMASVEREGLRDRGIAGVLDLERQQSTDVQDNGKESKKPGNKSVFDGLTANRRSCVMCGYTEAVMHFGFDNWQLALPRLATSCRLEDCLEDYTRLEILKDCICRKCSVLATHKRLLAELKTLEEALAPQSASPSTLADSSATSNTALPSSPPKTKPSQTKKKKHKEAKKMEQRIRTALEEGRIEDETLLGGVKLEKVISPASTKQSMIARPPQVLALHLNRSMHYGQYAAKNTIRVFFPEVLDLTPFTTSGSLSTIPTSSISTPSPLPAVSVLEDRKLEQPHRPTTPTQETYAAATQRTIYRLTAVVCHYGQHSFGHYICYRRKPRRGPKGEWVPPTLVDPLKMDELSLDMEIDGTIETDVETETDEHGTLRNRKGLKQNGSAKSRASGIDYFGAVGGSPRYYWEDHTETETGTNKGWLRISDDSVEECGIERVIAEASAAFMLYYEKAVHPIAGYYSQSEIRRSNRDSRIPNGIGRSQRSRSRSRTRTNGNVTESEEGDTDADGFSIGSEETLKPQLKVMDLNGSVGSLISEVGVGVLKREKSTGKARGRERDKDKGKEPETKRLSMSMSMSSPDSSPSSSLSIGARIIQNVTAGRQRSLANGNGNGHYAYSSSSSSSDLGSPTHSVNYSLSKLTATDESVPQSMIASAPSILNYMSSRSSVGKSGSSLSSSHGGVGSKSTKVIHHRPPLTTSGIKVKAQ